jgi:hypothetical protein
MSWNPDTRLVFDAASRIAGTEPAPDWLISVVSQAVLWIRSNHETQDTFPTRSDLRKRLIGVRYAAKMLSELFTDWTIDKQAILSLLEAGGIDQATVSMLAEALPKLSAAATTAPTPKKGKGRHKAFTNPHALTPQDQCAALVAYGWHRVRGELPPHTSEDAHSACKAVFDSAELPSHSHWGDSQTGWLRHLRLVNDLSHTPHDNGSFHMFRDGLVGIQDDSK